MRKHRTPAPGNGGGRSFETVRAIQERHQDALMAMKGVVGVCIGALADGAPCITVLVRKRTPELKREIPSELEGCPVVLEVTGPIRPMGRAGR